MQNRRTIIKARYIWNGMDYHAIPNAAILIDKGRIVAVGSSSELLSAPEADILDFASATVLPGLIDCHTHMSMDASLTGYLDLMQDSIPVLTLRATAMMRKDLLSGVTTCRCLGDKEFLDVACRNAVAEGTIEGPRSFVATRGLRSPNGHGFVGYPFQGVRQIRNAITENIKRGADFIKIYITGTLRGSTDLPPYLSDDEIKAAIDESHNNGKRIASHCVGGRGFDRALDLGLDTIEHAYQITALQAEQLAKSNTSLVLTPGAVLSDTRVRNLPMHLVDGHRIERDQMFASMAFAVKARIPFGVGTDGMHGHLWEDVIYLSTLGATPFEALRAATINGAKVCGIERETGTLQPGKVADIIAVEGNPLENLASLSKIVAVIQAGRMVHNISDKMKSHESVAYGIS